MRLGPSVVHAGLVCIVCENQHLVQLTPASRFSFQRKIGNEAQAMASSAPEGAMPPEKKQASGSIVTTRPGTLSTLETYASHSWLEQLIPDPETAKHQPNRTSREVRSGHYVEVKPTPLSKPTLVAVSPEMASELALSEEGTKASEFVRFFSGDTSAAPGFRSWATPYALSIYGSPMYRNCPFGNGNGYGDGRAISVAEVLIPSSGQDSKGPEKSGRRWEMQLKGAGRTPFCRGADGRAVLRSSVREFLVSEAMHHLGIPTTRALSLITSEETVQRPWYSGRPVEDSALPSLNDPRIAHLPLSTRQQILAQLRYEMSSPDIMRSEPLAITCRVAPSFLRVGHIELFARRVRQAREKGKDVTFALRELQLIFDHLLFREYPTLADQFAQDKDKLAIELVRAFSDRLAQLTADWVRVGYVQGNFNSDNCLAAGRTMDYGPFGFVEKFSPLWNMWSGGGEHFGFLNQPLAGGKNFASFVSAVSELWPQDHPARTEVAKLAEMHEKAAERALNHVWARKLGLPEFKEESDTKLLATLLELLEETQADYTLFWRELAVFPESYLAGPSLPGRQELLSHLSKCFYKPLSSEQEAKWESWLISYLKRLGGSAQGKSGKAIAADMRRTSPKYVPREWMLVEAYNQAMDK
eukprot:g34218.t1